MHWDVYKAKYRYSHTARAGIYGDSYDVFTIEFYRVGAVMGDLSTAMRSAKAYTGAPVLQRRSA